MILIISPMVTLILLRMQLLNRKLFNDTRLGDTIATVVAYPEIIFGVLYALARVALLVEAAYLLRDMPDSAFHVVDWMYFLPHI